MPLTLRPTGLSSPAYRDWADYIVRDDGRDVGRIYEDRHSRPELRWLGDLDLRQSEARHHHKRARGEPGRGQGAIPGELGKVPHQPTGACLTRTKAKTKAPPLRSWAVTLTVGSHSFSLRNPSLKASRTPSSISDFATSGTLVPWVPRLESSSKYSQVATAKVMGRRSVSAI
jgi:hypothetical protein